MPLAQLDEHFLLGFVLKTLEILRSQRLNGFHLLFRQVRPAKDVGVQLQGGGQVAGQGSRPETDVHRADALVGSHARR